MSDKYIDRVTAHEMSQGISNFMQNLPPISEEDVFGRVINALREKYGNAIDRVSLVEITQSNGHKVILEKIDTPELLFVAGRAEI